MTEKEEANEYQLMGDLVAVHVLTKMALLASERDEEEEVLASHQSDNDEIENLGEHQSDEEDKKSLPIAFHFRLAGLLRRFFALRY